MFEDSESRAQRDGGEGRQKGVLALAIVLLAAGALYAALAVFVRVDDIFFPGNRLALPGPLARVPGLAPGPVDDGVLSDRINILVLGLDQRPHHRIEDDGPPRSDSMYVLSIDPVTKAGGMLAIPRDLYISLPNPQGKSDPWLTRINTAYQYGVQYKYPGGGPALARQAVEQTLKIKINYYVVLDWVSFADIVDELGGVEITVPAPLSGVEAFNVRDFNASTIDIPAGKQLMNSTTALAYSRYRGDDGGDLTRIKRQQQVMQAAMDRALALGWLSSAPSLWSKYRAAFDTDITPARLPGLIALARQIGPERLTMASLAGERGEAVQEVRTRWGEDVLLPVWEKAVPIIQSVIYDRRLRDEGAQVRVTNATPQRGQSARVADYLTRFGLAPADLSSGDVATSERRAETVVVDYTGKDYTGRRIVEWLGLPKTALQKAAPSARSPGDPDIVVIIGQDLRIAADSPSLSEIR